MSYPGIDGKVAIVTGSGGGIGEVQAAFARLTGTTFKRAWRRGPDDPALKRVAEILRKAADDIERAWQTDVA